MRADGSGLVGRAVGGRGARLGAAAALAASLVAVVGTPAGAAVPTVVACGQTITEDTTLADHVGPCPFNGIVIGADGITLDLNGKQVFGTPNLFDGSGVRMLGRSGVTVQNGTVHGFDAGVSIEGGSGNTVRKMTIRDNVGRSGVTTVGDGVAILSSVGNEVTDNLILRNGPFSGVGVYSLVDSDHPRSTTGTSSRNRIRLNIIKDHVEGRTATLKDNDGIRLEPGSTFNEITGNNVSGSALDGIALFRGSANNVVADNLLVRNGFGNQVGRRGDGLIVFNLANNNLISNNTAYGNAANGIQIRGPLGANPGSVNNVLSGNRALQNSRLPFIPSAAFGPTFDMKDTNPNCDNNQYSDNQFGTANQVCIQ